MSRVFKIFPFFIFKLYWGYLTSYCIAFKGNDLEAIKNQSRPGLIKNIWQPWRSDLHAGKFNNWSGEARKSEQS